TCCWPVVTSVARICACWVAALGVAWIWTVATPDASVTTVIVGVTGVPGLLVRIANGPNTTSKRIWRPGSGAPPGPVATAVTAAVSPSQMFWPQRPLEGVTVRPVANSGAKRTVTLTTVAWPDWSLIVIATGTSTLRATGLATSTTVSPETFRGTGRTAELFDSAW